MPVLPSLSIHTFFDFGQTTVTFHEVLNTVNEVAKLLDLLDIFRFRTRCKEIRIVDTDDWFTVD